MIYVLYVNGRMYKTYKQMNHMTAAIRLQANRRVPPTLTYREIDEEIVPEFDAMQLIPQPCPECGRIPTRQALRDGSNYWHEYRCSQRR